MIDNVALRFDVYLHLTLFLSFFFLCMYVCLSPPVPSRVSIAIT
jgi:hypothetical protein